MNDSLLLLINSWAHKSPLLDLIMIFFATYLVYIVFAITVACIVILARQKQWRSILYFFTTLVISFILLQLAGMIIFNNRPFMDHELIQLVPHSPGESFPSNHTTVAASIAFGLLFFTRFKKLGITVLLAACAIGFARVFGGVHYPFDIIGGFATALIGSGIVILLQRYVKLTSP